MQWTKITPSKVEIQLSEPERLGEDTRVAHWARYQIGTSNPASSRSPPNDFEAQGTDICPVDGKMLGKWNEFVEPVRMMMTKLGRPQRKKMLS